MKPKTEKFGNQWIVLLGRHRIGYVAKEGDAWFAIDNAMEAIPGKFKSKAEAVDHLVKRNAEGSDGR